VVNIHTINKECHNESKSGLKEFVAANKADILEAASTYTTPGTLKKNIIEGEENKRNKEIGKRIKKARINAGYKTTQALSDAAGGIISQGTIARIERGDGRDIPIKNIITIAKTLKVSSDWLLGLAESPSVNHTIRYISDKIGLTESALRNLESLRKTEEKFAHEKNILGGYDVVKWPLRVLNTILSRDSRKLLEAIHRILFSVDNPIELTTYQETFTDAGRPIEKEHTIPISAAHMRKINLLLVGDILEDIHRKLPQPEKSTHKKKKVNNLSGSKPDTKKTRNPPPPKKRLRRPINPHPQKKGANHGQP